MEINFELIELLFISPILALFLASIVPLFFKVIRGNRELNPLFVLGCAFIGIVASAGLTLTVTTASSPAFENALVFDGISTWCNLLVLFICGVSLLYSRESSGVTSRQFSEYVFLLLNSAIGMMILAWSNDLIVTFIGIELMSMCLYLLIALGTEERKSKESAFKYFLLGSFASAILLYGISLVFGAAGTTYLDEIAGEAAGLISTNRIFLVGFAMIVIGYGFKVALAPFQAWTPDVYEGAPTPVTGFMATGVKVVTFVAFIRLVFTQALSGDKATELIHALEWIAVFTMFAGNLGALVQTNLKRMLAYSSIAHGGYVMVGVIAAGVGGKIVLSASGVLFYVFAYTIMTLGTFGVVCLFEKNEDTEVSLSSLKGLASRHPTLALFISLLLLSLTGIPPTIGFFGKFYLFSAAIKQGFFWMVVWGVINSVISVYYYLKPIVYMYMSDEEGLEPVEAKQMSHLAVGLTAILVLVVGLISDPFYTYLKESIDQLF